MRKDRLHECFRPYIRNKDKYERQKQSKNALRISILSGLNPEELLRQMEHCLNRCSERLRGLLAYRKARFIYLSLSPLMEQMRYNALMDGKIVVLPSPRLKNSFFLLDPASIAPSARLVAVRTNRISKYGRQIDFKTCRKPFIDMTVSEVVAANTRTGALLCDGTGFYDLHRGVMALLGWLKKDCLSVACVDGRNAGRHLMIPVKENDSIADYVVTPEGVIQINEKKSRRPVLIGEILDARTIRRSNVLFYIFRELLGVSDFFNFRFLRTFDTK
ncbi:5-formyltetrahydrofolate cyclo-ligase family protein [Thermodesulforhabdus norvegica]|uniref:5-formyltetrahydrofolate cyclo-ligase family protein n=1 Tax=Thermodesulforhabdus norvegica TaxID=39841 RepID=A0A1I4VXM8_9BACT|nr:5-formyltetrahydrofolate cyclo-ligase family protein [Thermodesulforhabdus norvegica]